MKEFGFKTLIVTMGATFATYLGGWDAALKLLVALMITDYVSGVISAWKSKTLDSEIMSEGGIKKAMVLAVIIIAVLLDQLIGDTPFFRTLAIYYYVGREILSVTENLGKIGVPLPPALVKALSQLGEKPDTDGKKKPMGK